ncbi:MAG TPA: DUF885 domain-containing protein [Parvularcula sp.]|nr:DUF885 domain-containing protein [Parvularcula sp.]HBS32075.1 DUF885 domain-containing protein [Parvularcula sp.]HBS36134.1 DUF885 domain-containing protein [Parvularcula sp.]
MTARNAFLLALAASSLALNACSHSGAARPAPSAAAPAEDQSAAINAWFEETWEAEVARSPEQQTFLGRKTNYDKWDDPSDAAAEEEHRIKMAKLAEMRAKFDPNALDANARLSYRLFEYEAARADKFSKYRNHWYRFSHFRAPHSSAPAFLINQHRIDTLADADAYIARLEGLRGNFDAHRKVAEDQFARGIYAPKWSYVKMIETARNVIAGAPFEKSGAPSAILADFNDKVGKLDIDAAGRRALTKRAEAALVTSVKPAYLDLIAMFERQMAAASNDDGAWKLPDGDAYYDAQLERMTTTAMTADEIHALGLRETARIHAEMDAIRAKVGFKGDLKAFFAYMRDDPEKRFTYPDTEEGRARYLAEATALIDTMRGRLDELFITKPKADMIVKRVEPFREKSAGKAFYQRPAPDGSRPGVYYANLYEMAAMPVYQMEALAYHEGIPGHHMQIAIAQELQNVPSFRRFGGFTAYSEGWGLYSEWIGKEMGFYSDPYSDFGRLSMELWRAGRLVVDTGLHRKKWTREQAIAWLLENTPNAEGDAESSIERYVVMPGQATAYKIGMLKIEELRARAEKKLGRKFDVREFHDEVLKYGPVPLAILEENIDAWIAAKKKG